MFRQLFPAVSMLCFSSAAFAQLVSVQLDYPPAELKAGNAGVVGFEVALAKNGRVTGCEITQSSGHADLDKQTCIQLRKTGQFKPAVDSLGQSVKSTYASKLRWSRPQAQQAPVHSIPPGA